MARRNRPAHLFSKSWNTVACIMGPRCDARVNAALVDCWRCRQDIGHQMVVLGQALATVAVS